MLLEHAIIVEPLFFCLISHIHFHSLFSFFLLLPFLLLLFFFLFLLSLCHRLQCRVIDSLAYLRFADGNNGRASARKRGKPVKLVNLLFAPHFRLFCSPRFSSSSHLSLTFSRINLILDSLSFLQWSFAKSFQQLKSTGCLDLILVIIHYGEQTGKVGHWALGVVHCGAERTIQ